LPNTSSAAKAMRQAERHRRRNQSVRSAAKTYVRQAREALVKGGVEEATEATTKAQSYLASAATKGVIHKNNAARRTSRLMKRLNKLQAGTAA
jgi:small subunit ribosomal protein S20